MRAFDSLKLDSPAEPSPRSKRTLTLLTTLWLVSVFGLFLFTQAIHSYIEMLVLSAQAGNTNLFSLIAKDLSAASTETYTQRYFVLFLQLRTIYFLLITILLLFTYYRLAPNLLIYLFTILPAALILGFTTSTRILGPFAGVLVAYYALRTKGKQTIPALTLYTVIALIATYISWPYLWTNPIPNFIGSLREMSLYPWSGLVLFNGSSYQSTDLPISYLPVLLLIQLTEPVWALSIAGWIVAIVSAEKEARIGRTVAVVVRHPACRLHRFSCRVVR
jgi:hypothetical protein